jgi:hypothetical protein
MKILKMKDVLTKSAYKELSSEERRRILKCEQAKAYSGFSAHPSTCADIISQLPADIWERYTAKQIGEIMQIVSAAYNAGKLAK